MSFEKIEVVLILFIVIGLFLAIGLSLFVMCHLKRNQKSYNSTDERSSSIYVIRPNMSKEELLHYYDNI